MLASKVSAELFASRPDGSNTLRLTNESALLRSPTWSPDEQQLAFLSSKTGWFEVWVMDISSDASGALVVSNPRQLTHDLHLDATSGLAWGRQ